MHADWIKSKGGSESHIVTADYDGDLTIQDKGASLTPLYRLFRSPLDCVNGICNAHLYPFPFIHTCNRVTKVEFVQNILYNNNICRFNFVLLVWILFEDNEFKSITGFEKPSSNNCEKIFFRLFTDILNMINLDDASIQLKQLCDNCQSEIKVKEISEGEGKLIKFLNQNYYVLQARGRLIFLLTLLGCSLEDEYNKGSFYFITLHSFCKYILLKILLLM
jgi:hypothetical protein